MRCLIYQVAVGKPSKLYEHCIDSVREYCSRYGITHIVQHTPKMWIKPDPFTTNRSKEAVSRVGCLPIFEKENAFDYLDDFDMIAIIDADVYVRPDADNIFLEPMQKNCAIAVASERDMNIKPWYAEKIKNYSHMQYGLLHSNKVNFLPNHLGFEFFNMGVMLINSKNFKPFLQGQTGKQFIQRDEFKRFVDGEGAWKWSTDQTLLNYFLKKYKVPTKKLRSKFNGLFTAVNDIEDCDFVHFFLKDKLPERGENVEELMKQI